MLNVSLNHRRQVNFRQFSTRSHNNVWLRFLNYGFSCFYGDFRYRRFDANLVGQLARFTTRHVLNAFFQLSFLQNNRLILYLNGNGFQRCLTLIVIITTTVTFTARLLLITGFRFFRFVAGGLARFAQLDVLLLLLTTVTAVLLAGFTRLTAFAVFAAVIAVSTLCTVIALGTVVAVVTILAVITIFTVIATITAFAVVTTIVTIAAIIGTRFTTFLLAFRLLFDFLLFLDFSRFGFFRTREDIFQGAKEARDQARLGRR